MIKPLFLLIVLSSFSSTLFADITWSEPAAISTALTDASDPRIVMDPAGNATAAWIENGTLKASSLPFEDSWTAPVTLSDVLNTASKPKLGVDSSGNVTALWIENTVIKTTTLPFGGSWNPTPTTISASGASKPVLVVDETDNAVAVWTRNGFIESSTRLSGVWSSGNVISGTNSDNPHIAISSNGKAMAAWRSTISGSQTILTRELTVATNTWGSIKAIFSVLAAYSKDYPKVAMDNHGNATVAWFQYRLLNGNAYQNVQVATSSLTAGATSWPMPVFLSDSGIHNPADLTIKLRADSKGNVLAVWTNSYDGETFFIESALKPNGVAWPLSVWTQIPSLYSFGFDLAATPESTLLVNMFRDETTGISIQSLETDTTNPLLQAWTRVNPFSTGEGNAYPQCAMYPLGDTFAAIAVWISFDGQNDVILASTGTMAMVEPPSNLLAVQDVTDFGVYQDYYNTITWDASPDPNVIQYNVFRNGIFFVTTKPDTLQCVDHNSKQDGTVTYGLAALLSNYRQSEIISFTLFP